MKPNFLLILLAIISAAIAACTPDAPKYRIGVAQCSDDIWRSKQNSELAMEANFHEGVKLCFASAYDDSQRQIQQIDSLVKSGVDLLIVAPNQVESISAAIDRTAESGVPVIVFERKTGSTKYTAFMSADNYEMGFRMARYMAGRLNGKGRILEITGLDGSSPAEERHNGFHDALKEYPEMQIISTLIGDWTEQRAYDVVMQNAQNIDSIDLVFGHNDRTALGARKAFEKFYTGKPLPKFCGIDGLPDENGGIKLVMDSLLDASYIYPTRGDLLLKLALDILEKRPYQRETLLSSAIVTPDNATVLYMESEELANQWHRLELLHQKADNYLHELDNQKMMTFMAASLVILMLVLAVIVYRYMLQRARIKDEKERMAQQQLNFYTEISHQLRTPLTLIEGPLSQLAQTDDIRNSNPQTSEMFSIICRNTSRLSELINKILAIQTGKHTGGLSFEEIDQITAHSTADSAADNTATPENAFTLLTVDDNADILAYLRMILQGRYKIFEAADGREGLEIAEKEVPDLIISDIMMPVMNGLDFCRQIKENIITSHIPVIMLTARSLDENQVEGYLHGADAYITKPFSSKLLLARIDNLLKNRHLLKTIWESHSAEPATTIPTQQTDNQPQAPTATEDIFVKRFREYVEAHISESELSVESLASEMGMSRTQFYRKIKALTGSTPVDLLRKSRLQYGRKLLAETTKTISEIAYNSGFSSPAYFTKCFKDEYGIAPGEMR
ncbi:MAG: substrate-binding domain-containing protein [Bacteroidales bacterium]|nr:substrate-binding domain-containing protein [Bacteroidales bacterium]